jgi:hypothetical protein
MTSVKPDLSSEMAPDKDEDQGSRLDSKTVKFGHEPQKVLETKTDGLSDRQS